MTGTLTAPTSTSSIAPHTAAMEEEYNPNLSAKFAAMETLSFLRDDVTLEEILDAIQLRVECDASMRDCDAGLGIPHSEFLKRHSKWLS